MMSMFLHRRSACRAADPLLFPSDLRRRLLRLPSSPGERGLPSVPDLARLKASLLGAVLTYGSSFGYVATAMALRPPHYQQHLYQDEVYQVSAPTPHPPPGQRPALLACQWLHAC